MASRAVLTCGTPHKNTKTLRMTQGIQAFVTSLRESSPPATASDGVACAPTCWGRGCSSMVSDDQSRGGSAITFEGCQTRRNRARHTIDTIAATTSTSHGPWKLETRYCGIAKEAPATRTAGHTSIILRKPTKAQISQKGTSNEKKGSWRPMVALRACKSSPDTAARAITGVPRAP